MSDVNGGQSRASIGDAIEKTAVAFVAGALSAVLLAVAGLSVVAAALGASGVVLLAAAAIARLRYEASFVPLIAVVGVGLGCFAGAWALAPGKLTETEVVVLAAPLDLSGPVAGSGKCNPPSLITDRSDAMRCYTDDGQIVEPCFTDFTAKIAWCPDTTDPPLLFSMAQKPAGRSELDGVSSQLPWAVQLQSGEWCRRFTKTVEVIDGQGIFHGCESGTDLLGEINTSSDVWTAQGRRAGEVEFRTLRIAVAWK